MPDWVRALATCAIGFSLILGCGGVVRDGGGGALNQAGAASSIGGSAPAAGGASAGSSATTSVGGSGTMTMSSAQCSLPQAPGRCEAAIQSFWHNPVTGLCEPFVYGGCAGNANRFATREACLSACPDSALNWGACKVDTECTLTTLSCCQLCEPIDGNALLAVNSVYSWGVETSSCEAPSLCAPCPSTTVYDDTGKYFKPVCASGHCSVIDIRDSELTACASDSDCELRDGTGCCPSCNGQFVAVSTKADFCPGFQPPCPFCISEVPAGVRAACTSGHCRLGLPTR